MLDTRSSVTAASRRSSSSASWRWTPPGPHPRARACSASHPVAQAVEDARGLASGDAGAERPPRGEQPGGLESGLALDEILRILGDERDAQCAVDGDQGPLGGERLGQVEGDGRHPRRDVGHGTGEGHDADGSVCGDAGVALTLGFEVLRALEQADEQRGALRFAGPADLQGPLHGVAEG